MTISTADWQKYIQNLSKISKTAGDLMEKYVQVHGFSDRQALIDYAYALVTEYGAASATLACNMYDAIAQMEMALVPEAIPAATATLEEVGKAINGSLLQSASGQLLSSVTERMVKQAGADTTIQNAARDGAQFAWVPSGDTCAFCLTLASRGWQYQSKKGARSHASHIHSHCDCQYAVRFNKSTQVDGYDPDAYLQQYRAAGSDINAMRRASYQQNREKILEQKRNAYAKRVAQESE